MRPIPNGSGSTSQSRSGFIAVALFAALACAGPAGKEGPAGPAGPPGTPADAGSPPDGGSAALTQETCSLCHGTGQIADDITLHKAVSSVALSRNFATIDAVTIPASAPIKPTVVFTVRDASGAKVTGLTSFGFTVAQLVPAATGGISSWRNVINRNYNTTSDPSIGGQAESSLPTAAFPAAAQAACTESSGTYTCVLGDDLSAVQPLNTNFGVTTNAFDPSLTTRFGVQSSAPTPGSAATVIRFTSPPWPSPPPAQITVQPTPPFTASADVDSGGTLFADARPEVASAACNSCHQRLAAHGGRRLDVNFCVTCHNAYSLDPSLPAAQRNAPDPYNGTVDFKRVLHKVHMGKNLPSVLAGGKFTFHGVDFSDVTFPQMTSNSTSDPGNCTACHSLTSANAGDPQNAWKNKPGMVACSSCHDGVSFANTTPAPASCNSSPAPFPCAHSGGPQTDDSNCALCHASTSGIAPIDKVHTGLRALQNALVGKYQFNVVSVTSSAPGQNPVVTFSVTDPTNGNAAYALTEPAWTQTASGASRLAINIAWSTRAVTTPADTNYTNEGSGANPGQPVTINALTAKVAGTAPGTFTVTSPVAIPANAVGVGEAVMEGHPADTTVTPNTRIPVKSATKTFAITGTATTARRQVVDINKCNACHGNLSLHGNNRTSSIETCVGCHNANATDISQRPKTGTTLDNKAEESIDFKRLIHGIHGAQYSGNGPVIYGFGGTPNDFRNAGFPGNDACASNPSNCIVASCEVCHNPGTYSAAFAPANGTTISTETLADPSTYLRITKITSTCSSCHASKLFTDHMRQMGGQFGVTQPQIDAAQ